MEIKNGVPVEQRKILKQTIDDELNGVLHCLKL